MQVSISQKTRYETISEVHRELRVDKLLKLPPTSFFIEIEERELETFHKEVYALYSDHELYKFYALKWFSHFTKLVLDNITTPQLYKLQNNIKSKTGSYVKVLKRRGLIEVKISERQRVFVTSERYRPLAELLGMLCKKYEVRVTDVLLVLSYYKIYRTRFLSSEAVARILHKYNRIFSVRKEAVLFKARRIVKVIIEFFDSTQQKIRRKRMFDMFKFTYSTFSYLDDESATSVPNLRTDVITIKFTNHAIQRILERYGDLRQIKETLEGKVVIIQHRKSDSVIQTPYGRLVGVLEHKKFIVKTYMYPFETGYEKTLKVLKTEEYLCVKVVM